MCRSSCTRTPMRRNCSSSNRPLRSRLSDRCRGLQIVDSEADSHSFPDSPSASARTPCMRPEQAGDCSFQKRLSTVPAVFSPSDPTVSRRPVQESSVWFHIRRVRPKPSSNISGLYCILTRRDAPSRRIRKLRKTLQDPARQVHRRASETPFATHPRLHTDPTTAANQPTCTLRWCPKNPPACHSCSVTACRCPESVRHVRHRRCSRIRSGNPPPSFCQRPAGNSPGFHNSHRRQSARLAETSREAATTNSRFLAN